MRAIRSSPRTISAVSLATLYMSRRATIRRSLPSPVSLTPRRFGTAKWVAKAAHPKTDANPLYLKTHMSAGHGGASVDPDRIRRRRRSLWLCAPPASDWHMFAAAWLAPKAKAYIHERIAAAYHSTSGAIPWPLLFPEFAIRPRRPQPYMSRRRWVSPRQSTIRPITNGNKLLEAGPRLALDDLVKKSSAEPGLFNNASASTTTTCISGTG